jgi:hypothetical protein
MRGQVDSPPVLKEDEWEDRLSPLLIWRRMDERTGWVSSCLTCLIGGWRRGQFESPPVSPVWKEDGEEDRLSLLLSHLSDRRMEKRTGWVSSCLTCLIGGLRRGQVESPPVSPVW